MSGGAFKNSSNLLGRKKRNRRTRKNICAQKKIEELKQRNLDIRTAKDLLTEDLEQLRGDLQKALILKNTAQMNVSRAKEQGKRASVFSDCRQKVSKSSSRSQRFMKRRNRSHSRSSRQPLVKKRDRAGKCSLPGNLR